MALTSPDKVYDFTANAALGLPAPGDKLDAQFLKHRQAIVDTQARLTGVTRDDGKLANGSVAQDQMDTAFYAALVAAASASVNGAASSVFTARDEANNSKIVAASAATTATASAADAATRANMAQTASTSAQTYATNAAQSLALTQTAAANFTAEAINILNDAEGEASQAYLYTKLAGAWAEHMPGTIPPDVLAVMGITGDHWSARWWANQADLSAQDAMAASGSTVSFVDRYLGARASAPVLNDFGDPIVAGALYFDTTLNLMRVYSGAAWRSTTIDYTAAAVPVAATINIDTGWWTFDGTTKTFPLKDFGGVPVTPPTGAGSFVDLDGTSQSPLSYTISGSNITFSEAPPPGTSSWMVAGVALSASLVTSFNGRSGNVTQTSADVTTALGYTPVNPTALSSYLTTASAASTYQTQAGMTAYLTTSSAASTYETSSHASSTYQTQAGMSAYQTTAGMSAYLTTASAASTYQTQAGMSAYQTTSGMSSYLTTATAASTYATISSLSSITIDGGTF